MWPNPVQPMGSTSVNEDDDTDAIVMVGETWVTMKRLLG